MNHEQVILFLWLLRSFCNRYNVPNNLQIHTHTKPFFILLHTKLVFVCFFFLQLIHLHTPHICMTHAYIIAFYSWQWMGPTNAIAACTFLFSSSVIYSRVFTVFFFVTLSIPAASVYFPNHVYLWGLVSILWNQWTFIFLFCCIYYQNISLI